MTYFMGIDGGGSHVRVVVTNAHLQVLAHVEGQTANPSSVGHEAARDHIQTAMTAALVESSLLPSAIRACGVGIAGASADHSEAWLRQVLTPVLPEAFLALASDVEIALVGANAERYGILLLSGTGSVAMGINAQGERVRVGGWGYLIGDEGSGFWIGREALTRITRLADRAQENEFTRAILSALGLPNVQAIVKWLYGREVPVKEVAKLAPVVLAYSDQDDIARDIIERGAIHLVNHVHGLRQRLNLPDSAPLGVAGGLLTHHNALRYAVEQALGTIPAPRYEPVVGGALLAKLSI